MDCINLAYHTTTCEAHAPDTWSLRFLRIAGDPNQPDESFLIRRALQSPLGEGLDGFIEPGQSITIIIPDKTRRCGVSVFLPILLDTLHERGIFSDRITILFANGTHPRMTLEEEAAILGSGIAERYVVIQHDSHADKDMVHLGFTAKGTPVRLNRLVMEADRVLLAGAAVFHYFAGFGGGPKLFLPGVAAYESAVANHRLTLQEDGSFHPNCSDGVIRSNPVAEDIRDAMRFFPPSRHLCVVNDTEGRIHSAYFGEIREAHESACRDTARLYRVPIDSLADCTILSAGGYPRDINFIQSHKTLQHAAHGTREGGVIICTAACADGIGNAGFLNWFTNGEPDSLKQRVLAAYSMNAHTAISMMEKAKRFHIFLHSMLEEKAVRAMGMEPISSLQEGIEKARKILGDYATVSVVEQGNLLVPELTHISAS